MTSYLKRAEGFIGTADQERFDECEEAVMNVLSQVRKIAKHWGVSNLVRLWLFILFDPIDIGGTGQNEVLRRTRVTRELLSYAYFGRHTCTSRHHRS